MYPYQFYIVPVAVPLKMGLLMVLASTLWGCNGGEQSNEETGLEDRLSTSLMMERTFIEFEEMTYDFGDVKEGEKVEHTFKFKNSGAYDLLIANAFGSCGCTVPEYPKAIIPPGQTSELKVIFNSEGREGMQHKAVYVFANTEPKKSELTFTANVIKE